LFFFPERDSSSVFVKTKTKLGYYGLRDRDYLLDTEIERIRKKYPNYFILNYYCFENYLYHPDNIEELNISAFDKKEYIEEIIKQKNEVKYHIFQFIRTPERIIKNSKLSKRIFMINIMKMIL
jgi:hypothetical protein